MMSYRLAFELGDRIAAIAAFIANLPAADECSPPVRPIPVFIANGEGEANYMPWDGGCVVAAQGCERGTVGSALEARDFWLAHNRCDLVPARTTDYPDIDPGDGATARSEFHRDCDQGGEVIFYTVFGGGHNTPTIRHPIARGVLDLLGLGNQCRDIEGARHAWAFLSRHTLYGSASVPGGVRGLTARRDGSGALLLNWEEDCGTGDRYGVYRGDLDAGPASLSPVPGGCERASEEILVLPTSLRGEFFLVVPSNGATEGSAGLRADGTARPPASSPCLPGGETHICSGN
jgi:hypothetical protein